MLPGKLFSLCLLSGSLSISALHGKLLTLFCTPRIGMLFLVVLVFPLLVSVDILLRPQNVLFFIILRRRVVWFVLCSFLFLSSPMAPSISDRHVHFGFNDDELLCNPRLFCYLLSLLKFCLWRQRNDYRFKSKPPSAVGLIASIKGRLSFDSPLFLKHYRSRRTRRFFQRRWGANRYIGKVVGDSFLCF